MLRTMSSASKRPVGRSTPPPSRRERRAQARYEAPSSRERRAVNRPRRPMWQSPAVMVTVAAVLIGVVLIVFARPPATASNDTLTEPPTTYPAALVAGDVLGASTAPVVMQVYADFQCPACRMFVTSQLPSLVNDFVTPGTLRIEARDIDILGKGSPNESLELAVGAACAAEQDRYWQFHDLVFWNQGRENKGDHNAAFIEKVATAAEVDMAAWSTCITRQDLRTAVTAVTQSAVSAGVNSTPTLVINGQSMVGVPDYTKLADLIRQLAASAAPATSAPASAPSVTTPPAS
jgi:protein-disulfide isomerase